MSRISSVISFKYLVPHFFAVLVLQFLRSVKAESAEN